jgi:hypothetical protein
MCIFNSGKEVRDIKARRTWRRGWKRLWYTEGKLRSLFYIHHLWRPGTHFPRPARNSVYPHLCDTGNGLYLFRNKQADGYYHPCEVMVSMLYHTDDVLGADMENVCVAQCQLGESEYARAIAEGRKYEGGNEALMRGEP